MAAVRIDDPNHDTDALFLHVDAVDENAPNFAAVGIECDAGAGSAASASPEAPATRATHKTKSVSPATRHRIPFLPGALPRVRLRAVRGRLRRALLGLVGITNVNGFYHRLEPLHIAERVDQDQLIRAREGGQVTVLRNHRT